MSRHRKTYRGRHISGILLVDKPAGQTSNAVLQTVKRLYFAAKAGHTGSLDPLATGMLPLCFGEATKFADMLLGADKHYQVTAQFGVQTTTGDAEGEIVAQCEMPEQIKTLLPDVLTKFRGEIKQIPSMYSAIKHQGVPLYKLARRGIEVERKPRLITIFALDLIDWVSDTQVKLSVHCSKGTYIRTLVEDIGAALGCGAHVSALRRTAVGHYREANMVSLATLKAYKSAEKFAEMDALLLPIETGIPNCQTLEVSSAAAFYLKQGTPIIVTNELKQGVVALKEKNAGFLGLGECLADGRIAPKKMVHA